MYRKQYADGESQTKIRMQRSQIEKLKMDNDRLKEDLSLETRQAKQANNMSASAQISKLQDQADFYGRKKSIESKKIAELKEAIAQVSADLLEQRKKMGGINQAAATDNKIHRQIQIYESRLDKALIKYNEAAAYNTKLNRTIGNLRRERVVCDGIYKKLERELVEKTKKMAEIIEISNAAYEDRDKAQAEMVRLKLTADTQQQEFDTSWQQLGQLIDQDRLAKDATMRQEQEQTMSGKIDPVYEEESRLRNQVFKGYETIKENKQNIHHSMERVQSFEEAFAKIQKATAITDIDELVQTFTNAEDQNFSLFNYVNDLSNEIEKLEESCAKLKEETKKYQVGGATGEVRAKKLIVENMNATLTSVGTKSKTYEENQKATEVVTKCLKSGIMELFQKVGCPDEKVREQLLNAGVTEGNMMTFLGVIEDRIAHLLQIYQREQSDDTKEDWDGNFQSDDNGGEDGEDGGDGGDGDDGDDGGDGDGGEGPSADGGNGGDAGAGDAEAEPVGSPAAAEEVIDKTIAVDAAPAEKTNDEPAAEAAGDTAS